jgi:hypothetical protein
MTSDDELVDRFKHHPPSTPGVVKHHEKVRESFLEMALALNATLPEGREKAQCFTKLEEAMFHANAAIARNQTEL